MPRRCKKISDRVLRGSCRLFKAANFSKDGIHIRILFLKETGNAWVKDIMYHNDCMGKYMSKFQHDMEKLLADDFENPEKLPY